MNSPRPAPFASRHRSQAPISRFHRNGNGCDRSARSRRVEIADRTGPLSLLHGYRVEAIFDVENLRGGARDLGFKVSFTTLAKLLNEACTSCALHAYFSRRAGDQGQVDYLLQAGFQPHPRDIETVITHQGERRLANSDSQILFAAGLHVSRSRASTVLIASGDGDLVCEVARGVASLPKPRKVFTLSLAGSTSYRLNAETNSLIAGNLEVGRDALHPWQEHNFRRGASDKRRHVS